MKNAARGIANRIVQPLNMGKKSTETFNRQCYSLRDSKINCEF